MKLKEKIILLAIMGTLLFFTGCSEKVVIKDVPATFYSSLGSVHDPSVVQAEDGTFYIFGSHMDSAKSTDLWTWNRVSSGPNAQNKLFDNLFDYEEIEVQTDEGIETKQVQPAFAFAGKAGTGYSVWAPGVIYNEAMGKYLMYFCTSSTYIKSTLAFAVSDTVDGPYHYIDTVIYSAFDRRTLEDTNVLDYVDYEYVRKNYWTMGRYNNNVYPNALDPALFYDEDGTLWMVYGSWSGGSYMLEIDEETGYPIHPEADPENDVDPYFGYHIAGGLHNSFEGPWIMYDEESGYYYFFISYGALETHGGYQIRQFRSKSPTGPYLDAAGEESGPVMNHSEYGIKMMGNYNFPSMLRAYMAPGHNSAMIDSEGRKLLFYHTRFDDGGEAHQPRVHQMFTNSEGWLVAAPFAFSGETLSESGFSASEIAGTYFVVNHGTDISDKIHESVPMALQKNGNVVDEEDNIIGSWVSDPSSPDMTITLNGETYQGLWLEQTEEGGNPVFCFTATGSSNQTVWGVKYY